MKNINVLFFGLTLVLSLVTFSSVAHNTPNESVRTALIVEDYQPETRFSIQFQKAKKILSFSFDIYYKFSFSNYKYTQNLNVQTLYKCYTNNAFFIRLEKLHTESYTPNNNKIVYNNFIV
ncbi:hypothetical protein [Psychroserpens luteolus]|uniref:hypothetical protein n=1 Tax=Psychroserpens luteolus TaxID=2855840 RepID=UPI001E4A8DFE|nr:hypothetical protein [Psychroserpens luteolus]MCD2260153.1 hypothetical protein [Psychroserpens luteolus]